MSDSGLELIQAQAHLARLFERDAKYFEAEELLTQVWDEPMPLAVRFDIGKTYARILRLRNKWSELDSFLSVLITSAEEAGEVEELAQLLVLRMESDLCAYPNRPRACIETADLLMSISQDEDLTFRALGHKGLSYLALGEPESARRYIDESISAAESLGEPYAVFLSWHFMSQLSIAILDTASAIDIGHRLIEISRTHAVARNEKFHLRDLSRAELLAGRVAEGSAHLASFLTSNVRDHERSRAVAYTVFMLDEAVDLVSNDKARDFADALVGALEGSSADPGLIDIAVRLGRVLREDLGVNVSDFVDDGAAIEASRRIFVFNSDCLPQIRESVRSVATNAPAENPRSRPRVIIDFHGALDYFTDSFAPVSADARPAILSADEIQALRALSERFEVFTTKEK